MLAHIKATLTDSTLSREAFSIFIWSGHAVFAFFIVSGFYISLVLDSRYFKESNGLIRFYFNRVLRLYPAQIIILFGFFISHALFRTSSFLLFNNGQSFIANLTAILANVTMLGMDIYAMSDKWMFVLGPVWSLSNEIYFYILAPFIVRLGNRTLLICLGFSLLFRLSMYWAGVPLLPWRYFYFPSVICFFLAGCLSYRIYKFLQLKTKITKNSGAIGLSWLIAMIMLPYLWENNGEHDSILSWFFYLSLVATIPFAFHFTKNSRLDRIIGQMAYPVYLSHMLVIFIVSACFQKHFDRGITSILITIAASILIYIAVDRNVDKLRKV